MPKTDGYTLSDRRGFSLIEKIDAPHWFHQYAFPPSEGYRNGLGLPDQQITFRKPTTTHRRRRKLNRAVTLRRIGTVASEGLK